jgi:hypothetical protein
MVSIKKTNKFSKLNLVFIIIFCIFNTDKIVLCQNDLEKIDISFTGSIGTLFPVFTMGFLDEYQSVLGGKKEDFSNSLSITGMLSAQWKSDWRISLQAISSKFFLQDNFSKETFPGSGAWRNFREDINVSSVPILLSFDWYNFEYIYKSYFSVIGGISLSSVKWLEYVDSPVKNDIRIGGKIYEESKIYPTIGINSGIELDFDDYSKPKFIRGLNLSTYLLYLVRYDDIYKNLRKQIYPLPTALNSKKSVIPFMFGIYLGIILNVENKQINRVFGNINNYL